MPSLLERAKKLVAAEDHLRDAGCELTDSETDLARLVVEAAEIMRALTAVVVTTPEKTRRDFCATKPLARAWLRKVEEP